MRSRWHAGMSGKNDFPIQALRLVHLKRLYCLHKEAWLGVQYVNRTLVSYGEHR